MNNGPPVSFGDNVRVRSTSLTRELGLASASGTVQGETTPSITCVEVVGELKEDYAVNVFFADRGEGFWFAPELLEFVDHAPGMEIRLEGVPKKWVRAETGEWVESAIEGAERENKPWWKFW
jgi:hypothetical protein